MPFLIFIVWAIVSVLAFSLVKPVLGQSILCLPREELVTILSESKGESQQVLALTDQGIIMEFWANNETGTWTQLASGLDGTSCLVSGGQAWGLTPADPSPRGNQI